jgi:hypothetical protein
MDLSDDFETSTKFEQEYVYKVYDEIATHFHHTRYNRWKGVSEFLQQFTEGSLICDIGNIQN